MTRTLPAGDAAVLVELAGSGAATRLAAAIAAAGLPGVIDIVPGARTVLVVVEPGSDTHALSRELLTLPLPSPHQAASQPAVEIPVCYDGPDLAEVATLTGLPVADVISRHESGRYEVGWLGFSPGFGYLTGLDEHLARVPRLAAPRLAVPAGSVAIAGGLSAVYPARSPGGWRLIGRTTTAMWDPGRRPPSLLAPGTPVRFRAVPDLPAPVSAVAAGRAALPAAATAAPGVTMPGHAHPTGQGPYDAARGAVVVQPGPLTTVQDRGRPGLAHLGVPRSGAADMASFRLANALAGNDEGAACLEVTLGRLALRFDCDVVAAVTGAPAPVRMTGPDGSVTLPPHGQALALSAGSVLRLGAPGAGVRSYVAVAGGFAVEPVLGSRSSDALSGIGPAPLRAGDRLPLGLPPPAAPLSLSSGSRQPAARFHVLATDAETELVIIAGPRDEWFEPSALGALCRGSYQVTAASNRTGLRLAGPRLLRRRAAELPSEGVAIGSLQVSHDGQPILLLADHPTTGGYPVIAVIRAADIDRAAQLRPGQRVSFRLHDLSQGR